MSQQQPPTGRARGRARGRSRLTTEEQGVVQPGAPEGPVQPQAPPSVSHVTGAAGGRRNHRGVSKVGGVEAVSRGMASMEISSESAGRGATRRREDYTLDNTRPPHAQNKCGTQGTPCNLATNYFDVISKPDWVIQQYHVDFAPNVESSRVRRGLLSCHRELLGAAYVFDGMSDLKTYAKMENKETELYSQRQTDGENIRITLKHVNELSSRHPELLRLFNVQMRRNMAYLKFVVLGRNHFDDQTIKELPEQRLQIWQGVLTSIRTQEERLMMVVDTLHKVVRKESVLEIIRSISQRQPGRSREAVREEVVGTIVMTRYNNKTYRVEDILFEENPLSVFERKGEQISFVDYYRKQYEINIQDMRQPLLLCISKEREVRGGQSERLQLKLLPEVCFMTGITDAMRNNFTLMKSLSGHMKPSPSLRVKNLLTFIQRINQNEDVDRDMRNLGLRFSSELVQLQGRVLPAEYIFQGQQKYGYEQKTADFSKHMRGKCLHVAKNLEDWIVITTKADRQRCNDFLMNMSKVCPPMGMRFCDPTVMYIDNDRVGTYLQALKEHRSATASIVVFIVPNNRKERYDALKKNTCIDFPIPSQVIVSKTLSKPQTVMSVATKIAIQMNCKLRGEPWALEIPLKAGVMVIGYDTYHDSGCKGRSAGGFVASLNQVFTRWYSRVSFHQAGGWEELSNHLKVNLTQAIRKYQAVNKILPNLILFYRDGVGDGQIRYVLEWEVAQMESTVKELLGEGTRYAFIVVNKRINTRFFSREGPNYGNPLPGTCVDKVVTRFDRYDFFLVSQSVREGTVAPTMYNIIKDVSNLKPDHIQRLSYKLTHLYYNWPGTIRVPAPCQYAHKLAFLSGQSLHREPAEELSDSLFYL